MAVAGIVTNVEHRVSKNGKGWASFSLEDFSGSYEFRIFGEDYLKFRHFLVPNSFLYVKIFGRKGWNNDVRLMFNSMQLLHDILEEFSKKITLTIAASDITPKNIEKLNSIFTRFPGKKPLSFVVYDIEEQIKLNLPSRSFKVDISNDLIETLTNEQIHFKLN